MVSFRFSKRAARAVAVSVLVALLASCAPQAQEQPVPEEPAATPVEVGGQRGGLVAPAGVDPEVWQQVQRDLAGDDLEGKDGPLAKVGLPLALLYREYQAHLAAFTPSDSLLRVVPDEAGTSGALVLIEAVAVAEDPAVLIADLEALGIQDAAFFGRQVSGRLPILTIERLAALESLQFARPVMATTQQ